MRFVFDGNTKNAYGSITRFTVFLRIEITKASVAVIFAGEI